MKNNNLIFKVLAATLFVVVSVLWVLSAALPDAFGGLNLAWIISIFCMGMAALFIARGIVSKGVGTQLRKLNFILATLFGVAAVCALIGTFLKDVAIILPVVALVLALGILISTLFMNGEEKWDEGDNHKPGYKNYYERKAEAEAAKANEQSQPVEPVAEAPAQQPVAVEPPVEEAEEPTEETPPTEE